MNWNKGPSIVFQELLEFFYHANFFIFGNVLQLKNSGFSFFYRPYRNNKRISCHRNYLHLYIGDKIISDFLNSSQYGYLVLTRHLRCELVWEQTYENWMWPVVNVYEFEMKYIVSSSEWIYWWWFYFLERDRSESSSIFETLYSYF